MWYPINGITEMKREPQIPNHFGLKNGQQLLNVLYLMETHDQLGSNTAVWQ
jgi:hypothetical protein